MGWSDRVDESIVGLTDNLAQLATLLLKGRSVDYKGTRYRIVEVHYNYGLLYTKITNVTGDGDRTAYLHELTLTD